MSQDWIRIHANGLALIKEGLYKSVPHPVLAFCTKPIDKLPLPFYSVL